VRREPRFFAALWSVDGGGRSFLAIGDICFVAGSILPLLLVGAIVLGLGLSYIGGQVAATNNPAPPRPRRLVVLPTIPPTPLPTSQPATDPAPPTTPGVLPGLLQPLSIQVIERDLAPLEVVEPEPEATPEPAQPLTGWPVRGAISQGFGCSPYYTGISGPGCPAEAPWFHDGVDIAAGAGTPVRASLAGTVVFAGADGGGPVCRDGYRGYGLAVVIDGGAGWQALYAHLARVDVTVGQVVTPETIIGSIGKTGCVSGVHLHFGLRHNGRLVDPEVAADRQGEEKKMERLKTLKGLHRSQGVGGRHV
jgi:murein DD-endopeptidase MepM/ murein hydrolase activator NlpD